MGKLVRLERFETPRAHAPASGLERALWAALGVLLGLVVALITVVAARGG